MTPTTPLTSFAESKARAERERADQLRRAARTVAGQARDRTELAALLSMLGLSEPAHLPSLSQRLAIYVHQVATAIGVPVEATGCEVTDTATAYLALDLRSHTRPDHDLMLVWDERLGWYVALETTPTEEPVVIAYLDGDTVPTPAAVARFVADTASGEGMTRIRAISPPADRAELAARMGAVCPVVP